MFGVDDNLTFRILVLINSGRGFTPTIELDGGNLGPSIPTCTIGRTTNFLCSSY